MAEVSKDEKDPTESLQDRIGAADAAVARAHKTELAVEVDTSSHAQQQAKKAAEEAAVLPMRAVNPLKPQIAAQEAGTKVKLSLEEYKRRRGLE